MAKLIVKSPYIKGGGKAKVGGLMSYIATRDGVELLPVSGYMDYMGNRPRVEKLGNHGLFGDEDRVDLAQRMAEIDGYTGNIWTHILSLKRADATRLGYDNAKSWRDLLRTHRNEIATAMHIPLKNFRWYAAFHDEGEHPHVHMMAWSSDPTEGYLDREDIRYIRSELTNDIFRQEMLHLCEQKSQTRNQLMQQAKKAVKNLLKALQKGVTTAPEMELLLLELSQELVTTKGKKSYGYLSKQKKKLVDDVVDEMAKHPAVEQCYRQWQDLQAQIEGYYHNEDYDRKPLSQEETFRSIKNIIVREADALRLKEITFEEVEPPDLGDQQEQNYRYHKLKEMIYSDEYYLEARDEAVEDMKKLARTGNTWAQYRLGTTYRDGMTVLPDSEQARDWFAMSAKAGNVAAQCALGQLLCSDDVQVGNPTLGLQWLEASFKNGNAHAGYLWAKAHLDTEQGLECLKKSADMGSPNAQYLLAKLYLTGQAEPPTDSTAAQLLAQASAQGHPYADLLLERLETSPAPTIVLTVCRLFQSMGEIFQDSAALPKNTTTIDRKRFAQLMEKRQGLGMKDAPTNDFGIQMGGY